MNLSKISLYIALIFIYFSIKACALCKLFEYKTNFCELPNEMQVLIAQQILNNEPAILYPLKVTKPEKILIEHTEIIYSIEFISKDKFIACSLDGSIFLYDLKTDSCKKIFQEKDGSNVGFLQNKFCVISPDKKLLAIYSNMPNSREIKVFQLESILGKSNPERQNTLPLFILNGHKARVSSVKFSADSKYLLSTSWDSTAKLWEIETGKCKEIFDHVGPYISIVYDADINENNELIVTICDSNIANELVLKIWQRAPSKVETINFENLIKNIDDNFSNRGFNLLNLCIKNNIIFITGKNSSNIYTYDFEKKEMCILKALNNGFISSVHFDKNSERLIKSSLEPKPTAYFYNGKNNITMFENSDEILNANVNHNNKIFITTSSDKKVKLWNIPDFRFLNIKQALFLKLLHILNKDKNNKKLFDLIKNLSKDLQIACKEAFLSFTETQRMLLKKHLS